MEKEARSGDAGDVELVPTPAADPAGASPPDDEMVADEASSDGFVSHLQAAAEPVANAVEPIVEHVVEPVASAIGTMIEAAAAALSGRSATERRLNRQNREPLSNLYELHPDARSASPRELGLRFVPLEDIVGTAVAGAAQRGGDFLPLGPFRGENWAARWDRIRAANERLQPLPPVDLIKYDGTYWVVDGHNRVAAALYAGGAGLDAMVTELVPLDGQTSERPTHLAGLLSEASELRAAAAGHRPASAIRYGDHRVPREMQTIDESPAGGDRQRGAQPSGEQHGGEPRSREAGGTDATPSTRRSIERTEN